MRATLSRRGGFTLVELLVAVSIMLVLIGLALLVANSGIIGNARTSSGSDRIAGWFMQARAKAQRDGAPRGLRLIPDPSGSGFCREAVLVEVPEPYAMPAGYSLMIENSPGPSRRIYVIPTAGGNALAELNNNIAAGDTLSIPSTSTIHRIQAIQAAPNVLVAGAIVANAAEIVPVQPILIPDLGAATSTVANVPTYSTTTFGFIRQARATYGEPPLMVPDSVAIDLNNCQIQQVNGNYDIVFAPNGEVQNAGGLGRIVLWTRNPEAFAGNPRTAVGGGDRPSYEAAGEMRLIVVYTKTGAVAVQPVALPAGNGPAAHDPYSTTKDGIASGL